MVLPLTKDVLRAAYNFLNETSPFDKWNLPDGDDIQFRVMRSRECQGWYTHDNGKHSIAISSTLVGHVQTLIEVMAHEMVHVHERHARSCISGVEHSRAFRRWAAQVCAVHGFDPRIF